MAKVITHMVGNKPYRLDMKADEDVRTRCGKGGNPEKYQAGRYTLIDDKGNSVFATTLKTLVTCQKCSNLLTIGRFHQAIHAEDAIKVSEEVVARVSEPEVEAMKETGMYNDPEVLAKLLRAVANGTDAKVSRHDVVFNAAAEMIEEMNRCRKACKNRIKPHA